MRMISPKPKARHRQRDRQDRPERQVQPEVRRGQQGPGIGAHRVERDVAQIQQAGKAHHDVQAQRQHHVQQRKVQDAHPALPGHADHKGQHRQHDADQRDADQVAGRQPTCFQRGTHARSPTRSPNRPDGRKINTSTSTKTANTSW
ncbi:hypothetical protein G6F57_021074 [Rhizopus arrhizus]|nr:hypothetical protein G6F57_021074 [Rhizopus arrhizus]